MQLPECWSRWVVASITKPNTCSVCSETPMSVSEFPELESTQSWSNWCDYCDTVTQPSLFFHQVPHLTIPTSCRLQQSWWQFAYAACWPPMHLPLPTTLTATCHTRHTHCIHHHLLHSPLPTALTVTHCHLCLPMCPRLGAPTCPDPDMPTHLPDKCNPTC
jgi:hypothetical protein